MGLYTRAAGTARRRVSATAFALLLIFVTCLPGRAEPAPVNLDLSSTARTVAPTSSRSATINVGGVARTVQSSDLLTAAERIALIQVLQTGMQSIHLGTGGNAVGGQFSLSSIRAQAIGNLVIPTGVTAVRDFGKAGAMGLLGNLTNSGSLYGFSTNPALTTAAISAMNVFNNTGATLSTVTPAGLAGGNALATLNLSLSALKNIVNAGSISSSGSLTLSAGGCIINAAPGGAARTSPIMQALNNVSLVSDIVTNSGTIRSLAGNVNITGATNGALTVNNAGGTISALQGNITFREETFSAKANTDIRGGNLLSREVNVFGGKGIANIQVEDLTGKVNVSAGEVHVSAETSNLMLGKMHITGDPTFFNTTGDVTITEDEMTFAGQDLAIVASRNVLSNTSAPLTISTAGTDQSSEAQRGGNITLIAGASVTSDGDSTGINDTTSTLTISGASATGGKIDLTGGAGVKLIDAGSSSGDAGKILLAAFRGANADSGMIRAPGTDLSAVGATKNGSIAIYGGMSGGNSVSAGNVTTGGAVGTTGGSITIVAAQPKLPGNGSSITVHDGTLSADLVYDGESVRMGNVSVGQLTPGAGGRAFVETWGNLSLPAQTVDVSSATNGGDAALIFGTYAITGSGGVFLKADGDRYGGRVLIESYSADGDIVIDSASNFRASAVSSGGSAGTIAVVSTRNLTVSSTDQVKLTAAKDSSGGRLMLIAGMGGDGLLSVNGDVNLSTSGYGIGGSIVLVSSSTSPFIVDPTASQVNGIQGNLTTNSESGFGGSIYIMNRSTGGVTIADTTAISAVATVSGGGGSITINDQQDLMLPITYQSVSKASGGITTIKTSSDKALLDVSAAGKGFFAMGGTITIGGSGLIVDGPALTLKASGTTAGSVKINLINNLNPSGAHVTIGTGSGEVTVADSGSMLPDSGLTVEATGDVVVNPQGLSVKGTDIGANLTFSSQSNLKINGSLDASATSGSGGTITLYSGASSSEQFVIGPAGSIGANGIAGTLSANGVGGAGVTGDGGTVRVYSGKGIHLLNPSSISVLADNGNGGQIYLSTEKSQSLPSSSLHADFTSTPATLTIGGGTLAANAACQTSHYHGGYIALSAGYLVIENGVLNISANGVDHDPVWTGNGGQVVIYSTYGSLQVDSNHLTISCNSSPPGTTSGGHGGIVKLVAGRDLTIQTSAINAQPAGAARAGSYYYFQAGLNAPGNLNINGSLNATASNVPLQHQDGGSIILISNSSSPFSVGTPAPNGINGQLLASAGGPDGLGGEIQIVNTGTGGVTVPSPASLNVASSGNTGGYINLGDDLTFFNSDSGSAFAQPSVVSGRGPLTIGAGTLNVSGSGNNGTGGLVRLAGSDININGGMLSILANGSGTGSGGGASITTSNGGISLGSAAGQIKISAAGGIQRPDQIYSSIADRGTGLLANVVVTAGGDLNVDASAINLAGNSGSGGGRITLTAGASGAGSLLLTGSVDLSAHGTRTIGGSFIARGGNCATCSIAINGSINVSGPATAIGTGGVIAIESYKNGPISIGGDLKADGGQQGGDAGSILIGPAQIGTGSPGGTISLTTPVRAPLTAPLTTFSARAFGTNSKGGSITVNAKEFSIGNGHLNIVADSAGNADAPMVSVRADGTAGSLSIGPGARQFSVSVRGGGRHIGTGDNGEVTPTNGLLVVAGKDLTVDPLTIFVGASTGDVSGGNVEFRAGETSGGNLFVNGSMSVNGNGTGQGGVLKLTANSSAPFTVGGGAVANGVSGNLSAVSGATGGDGGLITIKNKGTGGIVISNSSALAVAGKGGGGVISIDARTGYTSGAPIVLAGGTYNLDGVDGKGGALLLRGGLISTTGPVTVSANGGGTHSARGGQIDIEQYSGDLLGIGALYGLRLSAHGGAGGGSGGGIIATSAGDLSVDTDPAGLDVAPQGTDGGGATFILTAGKVASGKLFVNGSLHADANGKGDGGAITLSSNSSVTFSVGGSSCTNCLAGAAGATAATGTGGNIYIINTGGGITVQDTSDLAVSPSVRGAGGVVSIIASNDVRVESGTGISADAAGGDYQGGSIVLSGANLTLPAGFLLSANASGLGKAGTVSVQTTADSADIVVGGTGLTISARGVGISGLSEVVLNAGRALTVDPLALTFGPASGIAGNGGQVELRAAAEVLIQGALHADGSISGSGGGIIIRSKSNQAFVVGGGSGITNGSFGELSANAASAADGSAVGNGGGIDIINYGAASSGSDVSGITVADSSSISVATSFGNGGYISLNAASSATGAVAGPLSIPSGTYDVSGQGGYYSGGAISLAGSTIANVPLTLVSRAHSFGSGGYITLKTTDPSSAITLADSNIVIDVRAGSSGGANGSASVTAGGNLTVLEGGILYKVDQHSFGGNVSFQGQNVQIQTVLDVSGVERANGGFISIITNSSDPFIINDGSTANSCMSLIADSGTTVGGDVNSDFGSAGAIMISNHGTGGIVVAGTDRLSVQVRATTSGGVSLASGGIILLSTAGDLSFTTTDTNSTLSADSTGGQGEGGVIGLDASAIIVNGPKPLTISTFGPTGSIAVITTGSAGDITVGNNAGQLIVNAESPGILSSFAPEALRAGGSVSLSAARNLTIDSQYLSINNLDYNGANGGHIALAAATSGAGDLIVTGNLRADGIGYGNAGTISISYVSDSTFTVGSTVSAGHSGVSGNISADLLRVSFLPMDDLLTGSGNAGAISIRNGSHSPLQVSVASSISASTFLESRNLPSSTLRPGRGSLTLNASFSDQSAVLDASGSVNAAISAAGFNTLEATYRTPNAMFMVGKINVDQVSITADHVDIRGGTISGSSVTLQPLSFASLATSIGTLSHASNVFDVVTYEFNNVQATELIIGNVSDTRGVSLARTLDLTSVSGLTDIDINNGGAFSSNGYSLIAPGKQISIVAKGISVAQITAASIQLNTTSADFTQSSGQLQAGSIVLQGAGASFGTALKPLLVAGIGGSLSISGTTSGSGSGVWAVSNSDVSLGGFSTTSGSLQLVVNNGGIAVTGDVLAAATLTADTGISANSAVTIGRSGSATTLTVKKAGAIVMDTVPVTVNGAVTASTFNGDVRINGTRSTSLNLKAGGSGSVAVTNTDPGLLTLAAASAGGSYQLTTAGALTTSTITASGVSLSAQGNLSVGGAISSSGQPVSVTSGAGLTAQAITGSGVTVNTQGNTTVGLITSTGKPVSITSGGTLNTVAISGAGIDIKSLGKTVLNGAMTSSGQPVSIDAGGALNASTVSGTTIVIGSQGDAVLSGAVTAGSGSVSINSTGALTTAAVSGTGITIHAQGKTALGGAISGGSQAVSITSISGALTAVAITGVGVTIGAQGNTALNGAVTSNGQNVSITSGGTLNTLAVTGAGVSMSSQGNLILSGPVDGKLQPVNITSGGTLTTAAVTGLGITLESQGNLSLGGAINGGGQLVRITTGGTGNLSQTVGTIASTNGLLLSSGSGNIGGTVAVRTQVPLLQVTTGGTGSVNISNSGALALQASSVGSSFTLVNGGDLTVSGDLNSPAVSISGSPVVLNFSIIIDASIGSGNGAVSLAAKGTGTISEPHGTGTVSGNLVSLTTANANIGSGTYPIKTAATQLAVNAGTTNSTAVVRNTGTLTLNTSSAGTLLDIGSTGGITIQSSIMAPSVKLVVSAGGNIDIKGSVGKGGGPILLQVMGDGAIVQSAPTARLTGSSVTLSTANGSIGTDGSRVNLSTVLLSAQAGGTGASSFLANTGNAVVQSSSAVSSFQLINSGNVTLADTIALSAGGTMNVQTLTAGKILVNASQNATSLTLAANGAWAISVSPAVVLTGDVVKLSSGTADIGTNTQPVKTAAGTLSASTSGLGKIYLSNDAAVAINSSGGGAIFSLVTQDSITVNGPIPAGSVSLTLGSGDLCIGRDIGKAGATVSLVSLGGGTIKSTGGVVLGSNVTINNNTGNIGESDSARLLTNAQTLRAVTNGANVFISNNGLINNLSGSSSSTFAVTSSGNIIASSPLSGSPSVTSGVINLSATATNATNFGISLAADLNGSTSIALKATGTGSITQTTGGVKLVTPVVTMSSDSGSIGTALVGINIPSGTVTANTLGTVAVNSAGALTIGASKGSSVQVTAKQITISGTIQGNTIALKATNNAGGPISIGADMIGLSKPKATSISLITASGDIVFPDYHSLSSTSIAFTSTTGAIASQMIFGGADLTTITANSAGNVSLALKTDGSGPVTVGASTGNSFQVAQSGSATSLLTVTGPLTAGDVDLRWGATSGSNMVLGGTVKGTRSVSLREENDGTINQSVTGATSIVSPSVSLVTNSGSIGTSAKMLVIGSGSTGALSLTAQSQSNVFLNSVSAVHFTANTTSAGAQFRLASTGLISFEHGASLEAGSINLSAPGIQQADVLRVALNSPAVILNAGSSGIGGSVQLTLTNSVSSAPITLTATSSGSAFMLAAVGVNLADKSSAAGGFSLTSFGPINVGSLASVSTTSGSVSLVGSALSIDGSVNAGTKSVTLDSVDSSKTIKIGGGAGTSTDLVISTATLSHIKAGTVQIGAVYGTSAICVLDDLNVSGSGIGSLGAFNLTFGTYESYSAAGKTITLGPKNLYVNSNKGIISGPINGTTGIVNLVSDTDDIVLNGDITVSAGGTVYIGSNQGAIHLGASKIGGGSSTAVYAYGNQITGDSGNIVYGTTVSMVGSDGIGSDSQRVTVNATKVILTGASSFIQTAGNLSVTTSGSWSNVTPNVSSLDVLQTASTGNFAVTLNSISAGSLHVSFANNINGSISVGDTLTISNDTRLEASGSGTITAAAGKVISTNSLNVVSQTGSIGSLSAGVLTNASVLQLNTPGSAYVTATNPISLTGSVGSLQLIDSAAAGASASIVVGSLTVGNSATLKATNATAGSIDVQGTMGGTAGVTRTITLQTSGAGSLSTSTGGVDASNVVLLSGSGGIGGTSGGFCIQRSDGVAGVTATSTGSVSLRDPVDLWGIQLVGGSTGGGTGGFNVTSSGTLSFKAGATLTSSSSVSLSSAGNMTTGTITTTAPQTGNTGNVSLKVTDSGSLTVGGNITANGGSILVQNLGATSGSIVFSQGVKLNTLVSATTAQTNGQIVVTVGPVPDPFEAGTKPANLTLFTSAGGQAFFGHDPSGISVPGPAGATAATVNAKGRNVYLNTVDPARTITLNQGVLLKADPPIPGEGALTERISLTAPAPVALPASSEDITAAPTSIPNDAHAVQQAFAATEYKTTGTALNSGSALRQSNLIAPSTFNRANMDLIVPDGIGIMDLIDTEDGANASDLNPVAFYSPASAAANQVSSRGKLVCPQKPIVLRSRFGEIRVAAGAAVLVVPLSNGIALYDLHDSHGTDVVLSTTRGTFALTPGRQITVTDLTVDAFAQVNPFRPVAHRKVYSRDIGAGMRVFSSEFSIVSAIQIIRPLALTHGNDCARYRTLLNRLMKDSAIIQITQSSSGSYSRPDAAGKKL